MTKRVGILALQGGYEAHQVKCLALGCQVVLVRTVNALDNLDALILPGGESTTLLKFFQKEPTLFTALQQAARAMPTLGTCAGAILLAKKVISPLQISLGLVDVTIARNAYGRQVNSHVAEGVASYAKNKIPMVFIRAPKIVEVGNAVEVLARCEDEIVCVRQGQSILATHHPELVGESSLYHCFFNSELETSTT